MKLQALIDTLETNIGRADDDNWTALCLQVPEAEALLREMVALKEACEAVRQYPGVVEYVGTQIMDMLDAAIETPNAELTGATRLYRGASRLRDGLAGKT